MVISQDSRLFLEYIEMRRLPCFWRKSGYILLYLNGEQKLVYRVSYDERDKLNEKFDDCLKHNNDPLNAGICFEVYLYRYLNDRNKIPEDCLIPEQELNKINLGGEPNLLLYF